jgi:hypothetical protein
MCYTETINQSKSPTRTACSRIRITTLARLFTPEISQIAPRDSRRHAHPITLSRLDREILEFRQEVKGYLERLGQLEQLVPVSIKIRLWGW